MELEEYQTEMQEILKSHEYMLLSHEKKRDYKRWLISTMQHSDRYQHVIHKIKYKLGLLRSQKEKKIEKTTERDAAKEGFILYGTK